MFTGTEQIQKPITMIRNLATTFAVSSAVIAVLAVKPDNYRSRGNDHAGQQVMQTAERNSTNVTDPQQSSISSTLSEEPIKVKQTKNATIVITDTDPVSGEATWTITQPEFVIDPTAIVEPPPTTSDGGEANDRTNLLFAMVKNLGDKMRIVLNFINNQHKCSKEISKNHDEFTSSVVASDNNFAGVDQIINRATEEAKNTTIFGLKMDEKDEILASVKGVVLQGQDMYNCGPNDYVVYAQYLNKVNETALENGGGNYDKNHYHENSQYVKWNRGCNEKKHDAPYTAEGCRLIKEGNSEEFQRATLYEVLKNERSYENDDKIKEFTGFKIRKYGSQTFKRCGDGRNGMFMHGGRNGGDPAPYRLKQCICTSLSRKKLAALEQVAAAKEAAAATTTTTTAAAS